MGRTFKDNQRAFKHLRHSESTRALGHSEGTRRALGGHSGTQALRHLRHLGTQALEHSCTGALRALKHSGTRALEALYLADSKLRNTLLNTLTNLNAFIYSKSREGRKNMTF